MAISELFENGTFRIIISSFVACLSIVASGSVVSYPSPAVPDLNSHRNPYRTDPEEESWIGGLVPLGAVLGGAFCGYLMDYLGRKLTLMASALPYAVGWALVVASQNIGTMYAGRFICGISLGMASGVAHVYIAETAPANLRGSLCSLGETFFSVGMVYVYAFGYFLSWQWLAVACIGVVLLNIIGVCFLKETPRWLLIQSQTDKEKETEAAEVLQWFRGPKTNIENEFKEIQISVLETKVSPWKDLLQKTQLKNMGICLSLFLVQQFCGNINIKIYTVTIFENAGNQMDPNLDTIIVGIVAFLGCLSCVLTVDIFGRKFLLILSTALVAVSMIVLGAYYKVKEKDENYAASHLSWIPLFSLLLNSFFYGTGIGPIPWVLPSELFPTGLRGKSNAICVAWGELCSFIAAKFFVNITNAIGEAGGYWILSGFGVAGCVISIFAAPETKKRSLEELQN
ncbi:Facilitated trehalose transporter Tret1 [Chamberlinius hualienensis]